MTKMLTSLAFLSSFWEWLSTVKAQRLRQPTRAEPLLHPLEPIYIVVASLEHYIPTYMCEEDIPRLAIAPIRNGETVRAQGFGVANTITRRPAIPETLFQAASNSKVAIA